MQPAAHVPGIHQVSGARQQPGAHGRIHRALLRPGAVGNGPHAAQHPARPFLWRDRDGNPPSDAAGAWSGWQGESGPCRRSAGPGQIPGHRVGRWRGDGRWCGAVPGAGRAAGGAGGQQLPAQRQLPGQPPAVVRSAGLPGLQGRHEADFPGRRGAGAGHPPGAVRHAAPAWHGLLAEIGADHPGGCRQQDAGAGEEDLGGHLRRCEGSGRSAA